MRYAQMRYMYEDADFWDEEEPSDTFSLEVGRRLSRCARLPPRDPDREDPAGALVPPARRRRRRAAAAVRVPLRRWRRLGLPQLVRRVGPGRRGHRRAAPRPRAAPVGGAPAPRLRGGAALPGCRAAAAGPPLRVLRPLPRRAVRLRAHAPPAGHRRPGTAAPVRLRLPRPAPCDRRRPGARAARRRLPRAPAPVRRHAPGGARAPRPDGALHAHCCWRTSRCRRPTAPRPPTRSTCRSRALAGTEDAEARVERVEAWREQTRAGFDLRLFPGGHFFLHSAARDVLAAVDEVLAPHLP